MIKQMSNTDQEETMTRKSIDVAAVAVGVAFAVVTAGGVAAADTITTTTPAPTTVMTTPSAPVKTVTTSPAPTTAHAIRQVTSTPAAVSRIPRGAPDTGGGPSDDPSALFLVGGALVLAGAAGAGVWLLRRRTDQTVH